VKTKSIKGSVVSGRKEGSKFIGLPWVKKQIIEKLGFVPYVGTLNIKLDQENDAKLRKTLKKVRSIEIVPTEDYFRGRCFKAVLNGEVECAVVIPEVTGYPEGIIEIIAPTNLRKKLCLEDGNTVSVKVLI
jgi:riboflavin kinase